LAADAIQRRPGLGELALEDGDADLHGPAVGPQALVQAAAQGSEEVPARGRIVKGLQVPLHLRVGA